ncbi:transposase [Streptomyces sp. TRM75561]|uniref:IS701 family transposase n=1 Tax=Streptomyces sp. TRM75561 TaxID=2975269 RepID=UPI002449572A|nr:transposase [Streptomyces sp. TRM75561]MDH3039194.1 transposase [Streptomyces sp. TRM75561]
MFARVAGRFARADLRWRMRVYVRGLLGQAARKNGWQLAEWAGHRTPDGFQRLLNSSVWDADALRDDVRAYVAERLGPDGVLIIDDTGFIKTGTTSAGVGRQYTGTSGKIDNCQIGVFAPPMPLVRAGPWWTGSFTCPRPGRPIVTAAGRRSPPDERGFTTKGELARDIVRRCLAAGLPATWVTADEAYGQDWHFRRLLEQLDVGYVVAVPKSQQIKSLAGIWRIDQLIEDAPADAWQRLSCGGGAKLPANLNFDPDPPTHHRWVMARRSISATPANLPTTSPTHPWASRSPSWPRWPAPAGRSRSASRPRRTSAASTSTRSAAISAGTDTSPWPCSPTRP